MMFALNPNLELREGETSEQRQPPHSVDGRSFQVFQSESYLLVLY